MALLVKILPANAGDIIDADLIPRLRISLGGGHSNPFQYSCLENSMDREAWQATVHRGLTWSWTRPCTHTIWSDAKILGKGSGIVVGSLICLDNKPLVFIPVNCSI